MKKMNLLGILTVFLFSYQSFAQNCQAPPNGPSLDNIFRHFYNVGSNPTQDPAPHILTITDSRSQQGSIWSQAKLDFTIDFQLDSYIYLGNNSNAADGITLTLQNDPRTDGTTGTTPTNWNWQTETIAGGGYALGAYGNSNNTRNGYIRNAISLEFDTYRNTGNNDPIDREITGDLGHVAFVYPKARNNNSSGEHIQISYAGNAGQNVIGGRLSNNCWRKLKLIWIAATKTLTYELEGVGNKSIVLDPLVIFGSEQKAYWGFTGATGASFAVNKIALLEIPQSVNATLVKSVKNITAGNDGSIAAAGDILEYTIKATYLSGSLNWEKVTMSDNIPSNTQYIDGSATLTNGTVINNPTVNLVGNTLTIGEANLGNVNGKNYPLAALFTFRVRVLPDTPVGTVIINNASARGEWKEIVKSNDVATTVIAPIVCTKDPVKGAVTAYSNSMISTIEGNDTEKWLNQIPYGFIVLNSTDKGFVITRTDDVTKIREAKEGMLVYDTLTNCVKLYNGTNWNCITKYCQ